jgi:hypothetical protein
MDLMNAHWPETHLDPVRRLHVMAAAVRGASVVERVLDATPAAAWELLSDFEGSFVTLQADLTRAHVHTRDGDRIELVAVGRLGQRARLSGVTRPGWCWLQSRFLIIGMAVSPEPDGRARVALTGGVRAPSRAAIIPIGARREAVRTLDRLEAMLDPAT